MAFINCSTSSAALGKSFQYNVILPDNVSEDIPTLYLLHGLSDDYTMWQRMTEIERYAAERSIAVVMPDGARSFYTDMKFGYAYYSSIVRDVIESSGRYFHLSEKREKTFIAGLSMGGYGAMKIAMKNPNIFCGAASLSGVLDIAEEARNARWNHDFSLIWGKDYKTVLPKSRDDLMSLSASLVESKDPRPKLYFACGEDDFMLNGNRAFRDNLQKIGYDFIYEEFPGNHNWTFWNDYISRAIDHIMNV